MPELSTNCDNIWKNIEDICSDADETHKLLSFYKLIDQLELNNIQD